MRQVAKKETLEALEMRGSTHLVLRADTNEVDQQVSFDLMVHGIEAQYTTLNNAGHSPTEIGHRDIYVTFEVREPAGNTIKFFDSHVIGSV
jgi:hypothetical protein